MRALNDALRSAFDAPGTVGFQRGNDPGSQPAHDDGADRGEADAATPGDASDATGHDHDPEAPEAMLGGAIRFKQSPVRLHPGEERRVSLIIDPERVHRGTPVSVQVDPGVAESPGA